MKVWRLLDTNPMSAAENMALDDALVELRGEGRSPDTIHFLQFTPRAVLVGFHQAISEEVRTGFCENQGIEVNRRITGGGAIFFDESQLGWEVICDKAFFGVQIPHAGLFRIRAGGASGDPFGYRRQHLLRFGSGQGGICRYLHEPDRSGYGSAGNCCGIG